MTHRWIAQPNWVAAFAAIYLAVLPMANTIALRNISLVALVLSLGWGVSKLRREDFPGTAVIVWGLYLLCFPLIADDHVSAWMSLREQWGRGVLAMVVGGATAAVLVCKMKWASIQVLGVISAVPLLIHLLLFFVRATETGHIPWGYWGRETHHADLGYAAGDAVVLMMATFLAGERRYRARAVLCMAIALLSTLLAESRAGMAFAILGGGLVMAGTHLQRAWQIQRRVVYGLAVGVISIIGLAISVDPRWGAMAEQLLAGFSGNAIDVECRGTSEIEAQIIAEHGPGPKTAALLSSIRDGDGSRVVVLRAGLELAWRNPLGSDGSRQAFQKLLRQVCLQPAISMAHTHNGWVDTMLALGLAGAMLYLWVLLAFCRSGYLALRRHTTRDPWALVLFALPIFWILRGFSDSVFRDHMLEMQGFVLGFALCASRRLNATEGPAQLASPPR